MGGHETLRFFASLFPVSFPAPLAVGNSWSFLEGAAKFQTDSLLAKFQADLEEELLLPSFGPAGAALEKDERLTVASAALPALHKGNIAVRIPWTAFGSP